MNFEISLFSFLACIAIGHLLSKAKAFAFLSNRESRFETLDGLRGFLALSVCFHHFAITYYWKVNGEWLVPPEVYYQNYGRVGVAIFFMITGFLFIAKLLNANWRVDWLKLFESRVFRIMPVYIFAVAVIATIVFHNSSYQLNSSVFDLVKQFMKWAVFHGGPINEYEDARTIIASVDWTLKYEWAFYLSLPLIALILSRDSRWLNAILCCFVLLLFIYPVQFVRFDSTYIILFLVGGIAAYMVKMEWFNRVNVSSKFVSALSVILLAGVTFYTQIFSVLHVIMMSLLFILIVMGNDIFGLLRLNSAKLLGEVSYSIYLLHGVVLYMVFTQFSVVDITTLDANTYSLLMPVIGVMVVLLSCITYLYIEKPFIEYGRQYKVSRKLRSFSTSADGGFKSTDR